MFDRFLRYQLIHVQIFTFVWFKKHRQHFWTKNVCSACWWFICLCIDNTAWHYRPNLLFYRHEQKHQWDMMREYFVVIGIKEKDLLTSLYVICFCYECNIEWFISLQFFIRSHFKVDLLSKVFNRNCPKLKFRISDFSRLKLMLWSVNTTYYMVDKTEA